MTTLPTHCGHPADQFVISPEGTSFCPACELAGRTGLPTDQVTPGYWRVVSGPENAHDGYMRVGAISGRVWGLSYYDATGNWPSWEYQTLGIRLEEFGCRWPDARWFLDHDHRAELATLAESVKPQKEWPVVCLPPGVVCVVPRGDFGDGVYPDWLEAQFHAALGGDAFPDPVEAILAPIRDQVYLSSEVVEIDAVLAQVDRRVFNYGTPAFKFTAIAPDGTLWRVWALSNS